MAALGRLTAAISGELAGALHTPVVLTARGRSCF